MIATFFINLPALTVSSMGAFTCSTGSTFTSPFTRTALALILRAPSLAESASPDLARSLSRRIPLLLEAATSAKVMVTVSRFSGVSSF